MILGANVSVTVKMNFREKEGDRNLSGLHGASSQLAKSSFKSARKAPISFSAAEESTYKLVDSDGWFETILADDGTKEYLEKNIIQRGKDVYFVASYRTIKNSNVSHLNAASAHFSGKFEVPVLQLLASGTTPPTL
jgi:hypothetical protein